MAIIVSSVVGKLKGRSGDFVFRNEKGKNIMSLFPKTMKVSKTPQALRARSDFAVTIKLAKSINSLSVLKEIWTLAKVEGYNSFQKIIKQNLRLVKNGSATASNKITPEGLPLSISSALIQDDTLKININLPSVENIQFPARVFIFLYFDNYDRSVIRLYSQIAEHLPEGSYCLDITLNDNIKNALIVDANPIIYVAVAGTKVYKKKIYWTITASKVM